MTPPPPVDPKKNRVPDAAGIGVSGEQGDGGTDVDDSGIRPGGGSPKLPRPLVRPARNRKLRGQLSVDGGHQQLHHETDGQRGKPAAARHHRLYANDGVEPYHWRHNGKAKRKVIPNTQAAVKGIGKNRGGCRGESILTFFG